MKLTPEQSGFLDEALRLAREVAARHDLDARLVAAAAVLESGWGESPLARRARNYFGIRAVARTPIERVHVLETRGGPQRFVKYASMEESFQAYGRLLGRSRHYESARRERDAIRDAGDPSDQSVRDKMLQAFVTRMAPVYCPDDPDYETKLYQIIDLLERREESKEREALK
jgi:flagellum-specific peptidoglycan hydrolase FlgJ